MMTDDTNPKQAIDSTNPKDLVGINKPRLSLVPPSATIYLAKAMENGANKYGLYNWREKKVQAMIYLDAAMRHIVSYIDGEEEARDSKVHHLAHAMATLAILVDAKETGNLIDNRPKKGVAADLIENLTANKGRKVTLPNIGEVTSCSNHTIGNLILTNEEQELLSKMRGEN